MIDFLLLMWKPLLACLVLTGIHSYLGIHIVERKVIFVDLAMAQIAALGAAVVFLLGRDLHEAETYWFSLSATFLGALLFSIMRSRRERIPQEAIIGIVYVVTAALSLLILSYSPEGDEHIRFMFVGKILLVDLPEIVTMALLYAAVGLLHWRLRRIFILISIQPEAAYRRGVPVKMWDLIFYLTFALVITSSVQIAGVLLVFSFLIVPAVNAILFSKDFTKRLILGWTFGTLASFAGISLSYFLNLPTGATIVCVFGGALALIYGCKKILEAI